MKEARDVGRTGHNPGVRPALHWEAFCHAVCGADSKWHKIQGGVGTGRMEEGKHTVKGLNHHLKPAVLITDKRKI